MDPARTAARARIAALGGATAGLAASPALPAGVSAAAKPVLVVAGVCAGALVVSRPRPGASSAQWAWLGLVALTAACAGCGIGALRLAAIDDGAFRGPIRGEVTARGFVTAVPRHADGVVSVRVQTPDGRLLVQEREPVDELPVG